MKIYYMGKLIHPTKRNRRGQFRKHSFKDTVRTIIRRSLIGAALINTAFVLAVLEPTLIPPLDASLEVENIVEAAVDTRDQYDRVFEDAATAKRALDEALQKQREWNEEMKRINAANKAIADELSALIEARKADYDQTLFNIGTI